MKIHVQREPEGGYTASVVEISVYTQGDTFEELTANLQEAIALRFEKPNKTKKTERLFDAFEITA